MTENWLKGAALFAHSKLERKGKKISLPTYLLIFCLFLTHFFHLLLIKALIIVWGNEFLMFIILLFPVRHEWKKRRRGKIFSSPKERFQFFKPCMRCFGPFVSLLPCHNFYHGCSFLGRQPWEKRVAIEKRVMT